MIRWFKKLFLKSQVPAAAPITIDFPDGVTKDQLVTEGIAHLGSDKPFDDLVTRFKTLGLSSDDADIAADRIAGGMTRAFFTGDKNRPNPSHDPLAAAAFDVIKLKLNDA